jgi:hypothetical protein
MTEVRCATAAYKNVTSSNWSIFHQWFLGCVVNNLQVAAEV